MTYETLIEPAELRAHLGRANWAIVDCRFDLGRPTAGREAYERGHIPGACYAHLDEDLSSPITPTTGRHPLPQSERLAEWLGRLGIDNATQVVAYDEAGGAFAARLWWLLRWLGSRKVAVLNGGFKAWERAGYPVDSGTHEARTSKHFKPQIQQGAWLSTEQVQQGLAQKDILLIDARASDRFAGQNETIDSVAGHIPGARNHPFLSNLDANQRFLPAEQLRALWAETFRDTPARQIVCMCGSGVTACHNLLALEIGGFKEAQLYAGSWSEWIRDPRRPIATGPESPR